MIHCVFDTLETPRIVRPLTVGIKVLRVHVIVSVATQRHLNRTSFGDVVGGNDDAVTRGVLGEVLSLLLASSSTLSLVLLELLAV